MIVQRVGERPIAHRSLDDANAGVGDLHEWQEADLVLEDLADPLWAGEVLRVEDEQGLARPRVTLTLDGGARLEQPV